MIMTRSSSLFYSLSDTVSDSSVRYSLYCPIAHFRCLDFSADSDDGINADFS